jgi:cell division transport system permease protein
MINIQTADVFANHLRLEDVRDKVNITVFFEQEISEGEAQKIEGEIRSYPYVSSVEYHTEEENLAKLKEGPTYKSGESLKKAIIDSGGNPLGASIEVRSDDPNKYSEIAQRIESSEYADLVDTVNYGKFSSVIDDVGQGITSSQQTAFLTGGILSFIAILITFNSIKITMYSHRQEIEIMRLVGASNGYIQMPYIWEGFFYGFLAVVIGFPLSIGYLHLVASGASADSVISFLSETGFFKDFLNTYFLPNLALIIAGELLFGIFLGVISSLIAVRKYLRV